MIIIIIIPICLIIIIKDNIVSFAIIFMAPETFLMQLIFKDKCKLL